MAYIGLDATQHERTAPTGGNPLPAGLYTGVITRTTLKDTKDNQGTYLEVEFDISSPQEFSNRKFWDRFNLVNKSMDAVRIGKEQLADLAKAAGLATVTDDTDLHGKEVALIIKVRSADGKFQASNECSKYWPVGTTLDDHNAWLQSARKGGSATPAAAKQSWGAQPAQPVAQASGASPKPWMKK